tara:strand:+ start:549 stop:992 length:444 start_codon:yes stop_codon:yes gene_type:complete
MTKKDLIKIIREAVRREVKKEVKKIFITEEISSSPSLMLDDIKPKQKEKIVEKQYTKNEALNKILNETVGGIQGAKSEYPTLGGDIFNTDKMSELMGYGKPDEVKRDLVAVDSMKKAGVTSEQVPEHVTNALTRDYSGLMKALNKDK